MNRRSFLRTLGIGVVATAALVSIPSSVIKTSEWLTASGNDWALRRLYKLWHAYYKEHGTPPGAFRVGQEFYNLFESELQCNQRFCASMDDRYITPNLIFKGSMVYVGEQFVTRDEVRPMGPYEIQVTSAVEWRKCTTIRRKS